jgi:hypothetical protein
MQDRPTYDELLAAIESFLDAEIVPNTPGRRGFHARVAVNALRIVRRELQLRETHLAQEWAGLDAILGPQPRPDEYEAAADALRRRNEQLCEIIRSGSAGSPEQKRRIFEHVAATVRAKLEVSDPRLLQRGA